MSNPWKNSFNLPIQSTMKKIILGLAALWMLSALPASAQNRPLQDRIAALRIAFYTEKLDLSPDESAGFWPIYNEYLDKEKAIRESNKLDGKNLEFLSDAEAEQLIANSFDMEERQLDLKREYYQKLRKVIPVRKIAMLGRVERMFKERLMEEIIERRKQQRGGR